MDRDVQPHQTVQNVQRHVAEDFVRRCSQVEVHDISFCYALDQEPVSIPAVLVKFFVLSVLFRLDNPKKWNAAFEHRWIPEPLIHWLGVPSLQVLGVQARIDWVPPKLFLEALGQQCGRVLIELAQPRPAVSIRQVIGRLFLRKAELSNGGLVCHHAYWKWFLRQADKPLSSRASQEVAQRIDGVLGQLDLAEVSPKHWQPVPELSDQDRRTLEAAVVDVAPERLQCLTEAFDRGLFDFIPNLFAASYSVHGRRAYHPMLLWKVLLAMLATGMMEPAGFLRRVNDSLQLRLFLGVMRAQQLPSARRVKGFLCERLAGVVEYVVLWFNLNLVHRGEVDLGNEFGTDGMEMEAQARRKSDATAVHMAPLLSWLLGQLRAFLQQHGRTELTEHERQLLLERLRELDWSQVGNISKSRHAVLQAIADALAGQLVTPVNSGVARTINARDGPVPSDFKAFVVWLVDALAEQLQAFGPSFDGATVYDPECGARTKRGKTVHGFGLQFLNDLKYGLVWAFAVFPAGRAFRQFIAEFVLGFQEVFGLGSMQLTSDREFTIAQAIHHWHANGIEHYGPRSDVDIKKKGVFTEHDFQIHEHHAICPNGKRLNRKPHRFVRGSNVQWRYQARGSDCADCPLRAQCTTGKGAKMVCINVYQDDLIRHAGRMKEDPERTRDLMGRHRALAEGTVNNLKHHLNGSHAQWKGLAMAYVQLGMAIVLGNTLKWHKIQTGQLKPVQLQPRQ